MPQGRLSVVKNQFCLSLSSSPPPFLFLSFFLYNPLWTNTLENTIKNCHGIACCKNVKLLKVSKLLRSDSLEAEPETRILVQVIY